MTSLTKREKEFVKEASELIEKKPELEPLVSLLNMLAEFVQDGFKKIEEKQTEFETTFRNIVNYPSLTEGACSSKLLGGWLTW